MGFAAVLRAAVGASRSSGARRRCGVAAAWLRRLVSLLRPRRAADRSVAVIVVPRFAPSAYADRGAVGLLVPGCGLDRLPRAGARLARARPGRLVARRSRRDAGDPARGPPGHHHHLRLPATTRVTSQRHALSRRDRRAGLPRRAHLGVDAHRRARLARGHRAHCERDRSGRDAADPLPSRPRRGRGTRPSRRAAHTRPRRPHGRDARARRLARRVRGARYPRAAGRWRAVPPCSSLRSRSHGAPPPRGRHRRSRRP